LAHSANPTSARGYARPTEAERRSFSLCARGGLAVKFHAMKIVLAYSGGFDTSVLLSWIKEKYNAEFKLYKARLPFHRENK
jgi:argininosuccinate synthase